MGNISFKNINDKEGPSAKVTVKSFVFLDVKPWNDKTNHNAMPKSVKRIETEGFLWGASKLIPIS